MNLNVLTCFDTRNYHVTNVDFTKVNLFQWVADVFWIKLLAQL